MPSIRQQIVAEMKSRLQAIRTNRGFQTDAGLALYLGGEPALGPSDPDVVIAMVIPEDALIYQQANHAIRLPFEIRALAKVDIEEPWLAVEAVLADIKKAIELEDRRLHDLLLAPGLQRGTTRTVEREPGSLTVGAVINYAAPHIENWGAP